MRRPLAVLAALLIVALPFLGAPASEARATHLYWPKTQCKNVYDDSLSTPSSICLDVYVDKMDGAHGLILRHVYLRVPHDADFENKAFDCDWLTARNDSDDIIWRKDNADCDIYLNPPYTLFSPQQNMPNSDSVLVTVAGWPRIDKAPDPGYTKISVSVSR